MVKKRQFLFISTTFSFLTGYLFGRIGFQKEDVNILVTNERLPAPVAEKFNNIERFTSKNSHLGDELCAKRSQRERLKDLRNLTPDLAVAPTISVSISGIDLNYVAFNSWTVQRARTIKTKEPGTLKWIATFNPQDTVWDIGANVGMYSIYAAKRVKSVYAFEPNNGNAFALLANIRANNLCNMNLFAIGLGESNGFFPFEYSSLHFGVAHNQVQANLNNTFSKKKKKKYHETEMKTVRTLDSMVAQQYIPLPDHIKLDVDGLEISILRGMRESLQSGSVKTLLVEAEDHDQALEIYEFMSNMGAKLQQIEILGSTGKKNSLDPRGLPIDAICNMVWKFI